MWALLSGIAAVALIIIVAQIRRRVVAHKHMDVGALSERWLAEHRGSRHN
jgi:hypothetical protein